MGWRRVTRHPLHHVPCESARVGVTPTFLRWRVTKESRPENLTQVSRVVHLLPKPRPFKNLHTPPHSVCPRSDDCLLLRNTHQVTAGVQQWRPPPRSFAYARVSERFLPGQCSRDSPKQSTNVNILHIQLFSVTCGRRHTFDRLGLCVSDFITWKILTPPPPT